MRAELIPVLKSLLPDLDDSSHGYTLDGQPAPAGEQHQMSDVEVITRTSTIRLGEDGIVRVVVRPNAEHTLEDAREQVAAMRKAAQGRRRPVLVDMREARSLDQEARVYFASDETANATNAAALLVGSAVSAVMASFFLGLNKPGYPTRLFTSEAEALDWLRGFLK